MRDNPALAAACRAAPVVVPLFVLDDAILATTSPNRIGFLVDALGDLDASLRKLGGGLVVRRGDWVSQVMRAAHEVSATSIHLADDVSAYAQRRLASLCEQAGPARVAVHTHPGVTVMPPGAIEPAGGGEFKVFTPYHRRWLTSPWRRPVRAPASVPLPEGMRSSGRDHVDQLASEARSRSPGLVRGGETEGLRRLKRWAEADLASYAERHDDLAGAATSRLSAFLHFGCLSPAGVAWRLRDLPGADAYVRQLCWRDFYHQVLAKRPDAARSDYRERGHRWVTDGVALDAWQIGQTGYPLVDAAMRQLQTEGFMHNRARMVVASFLTKDLHLDWRDGAAHFMRLLVDGDVASNQLNWQWTAGTGTDTNPHRIFNPVLQGRRFDPNGAYIRRYLPELADAGLDNASVHWPDAATRERVGYPPPMVDHHAAIAHYRAAIAPPTRSGA